MTHEHLLGPFFKQKDLIRDAGSRRAGFLHDLLHLPACFVGAAEELLGLLKRLARFFKGLPEVLEENQEGNGEGNDTNAA